MTARYLAMLLEAPSAGEVDWLVSLTGATAVQVEGELQLLHRVVGLLVAERDALDDQTAADVSHALDEVASGKRSSGGLPAADWADSRRDYLSAMASRGGAVPPLRRIAVVLLRRMGLDEPSEEQLARAVQLVTAYRQRANTALQDAFGATSLPEDQLPSDVWRERTGQGKSV